MGPEELFVRGKNEKYWPIATDHHDIHLGWFICRGKDQVQRLQNCQRLSEGAQKSS